MNNSFNTTTYLYENKTQLKQYLTQGKISQDDYDAIMKADKTPTKKYSSWMVKQWINGSVNDIDVLRNAIEEFHSFAERGKVEFKDINRYDSFTDLQMEVDELNKGADALSDTMLEKDYDIVRDDKDLLVVSPHTHEASRKLGLSQFQYRRCEKDGTADSAWCTTYKSPNHFNDYYYTNNVTFYYVKVKSKELQDALLSAGYSAAYMVTAIVVNLEKSGDDHEMEAYDGNDKQFDGKKLENYLNIIGLK